MTCSEKRERFKRTPSANLGSQGKDVDLSNENGWIVFKDDEDLPRKLPLSGGKWDVTDVTPSNRKYMKSMKYDGRIEIETILGKQPTNGNQSYPVIVCCYGDLMGAT